MGLIAFLIFYSSPLQASGQSNQDHTRAACEIIHQFLKLHLYGCCWTSLPSPPSLSYLSLIYLGHPEDDAGWARGLRVLTGSPEVVSQLPVWCQREFTVQTRGHAQSRHGEARRCMKKKKKIWIWKMVAHVTPHWSHYMQMIYVWVCVCVCVCMCRCVTLEAPADARRLRGGCERGGTQPASPLPLHWPPAVHQIQTCEQRVSCGERESMWEMWSTLHMHVNLRHISLFELTDAWWRQSVVFFLFASLPGSRTATGSAGICLSPV